MKRSLTKTMVMVIIFLMTSVMLYAEEKRQADTTILHKGKHGTFALSITIGKKMTTIFLSSKYKIVTVFDGNTIRHESKQLNGTTVNGFMNSQSFFEGYGKVVLFAQPGSSRISFGRIFNKYLSDTTIVRKATEKETEGISTKECFVVFHDLDDNVDPIALIMACVVSASSLKK